MSRPQAVTWRSSPEQAQKDVILLFSYILRVFHYFPTGSIAASTPVLNFTHLINQEPAEIHNRLRVVCEALILSLSRSNPEYRLQIRLTPHKQFQMDLQYLFQINNKNLSWLVYDYFKKSTKEQGYIYYF